MSRMKKFMERQKKLTRFQALKSIFSSMLMTVTVVVIATVTIPKSPEAEIIDIDVFSNRIVYNIFVQDSDSAIIEDTLLIEIENQSEKHDYPLEIGENTGVITELSEDTEYTIRVLADKGFGSEVLDKETFKTYDKTGGAFTNVDLLSEPDYYELDYQIGLFINDPFDEYSNVQIRYGFKYYYNDEVEEYYTVPINKTDTEFLLNNVYNEDTEIHIYIEATNSDFEIVELDYMMFRTPFNLYGSMYINQVSYDLISVSTYPEYPDDVEVEYELILMRNYTEEDRIILERPVYEEGEYEPHHMESSIVFDGLKPNVEYTIKLVANYRNPYTLVMENKVLSIESATTLEKPKFDIEVIDNVDSYEVTLTIDEPLNSYDKAYYIILEDSEFGYMQYEFQEYDFEYYDNQYHATMFINKPLLNDYKIEIAIKNSLNYTNFSILYIEEYHEEVE